METSFLHSMNLVFCFSRKYQTRQNHMKIIFLVFVFPSDFFIFDETFHVNANIIFFSSAYYNIYCNYVSKASYFSLFFLFLFFGKPHKHTYNHLFLFYSHFFLKRLWCFQTQNENHLEKYHFLEFNHDFKDSALIRNAVRYLHKFE